MYDLKTCSRDFAYPYPPKPPDLEDVACGLRVTASLVDLFIESYFRDASTDGVCNTETLSLLSANDYHGVGTARFPLKILLIRKGNAKMCIQGMPTT